MNYLHENVLSIWEFESTADANSIVIPDGCRDLIVCRSNKQKPKWFVSPLFNTAKTVSSQKGTHLLGFRMKPGVEIQEKKLLAAITLQNDDITIQKTQEILSSYSSLQSEISDALQYLASANQSIKKIAKDCGVSQRTFQRHITQATGKTPIYWTQLARVTKATRALYNKPGAYAEIAICFGYSDQAHMCREIKRWFGITPSQLQHSPDIEHQIIEHSYV